MVKLTRDGISIEIPDNATGYLKQVIGAPTAEEESSLRHDLDDTRKHLTEAESIIAAQQETIAALKDKHYHSTPEVARPTHEVDRHSGDISPRSIAGLPWTGATIHPSQPQPLPQATNLSPLLQSLGGVGSTPWRSADNAIAQPAISEDISSMQAMRLSEFDFNRAADLNYLAWFSSYRGRPWQDAPECRM